MKRALLVAALLAMSSFTAAVVGYDGPEDQPHIMGATGSSGASKAVSPNGTMWTAEVSMVNRTPDIARAGTLENITYSSNGRRAVEFTGYIQAGTPCQVIEHEVEKQNETYLMNVKTVKDDLGGLCVQQVVAVEYAASFQTDDGFELVVQHNGEEIERLEHPEKEVIEPDKGPERDPSPGFVAMVAEWLDDLF